MEWVQMHEIVCPHCWETVSIPIDVSVPSQSYIEDCTVCCKSIAISYSSHDAVVDSISADPAD